MGLSFLIERLVPQNHSQIRYLYVLKSLLNFNGVNCGNFVCDNFELKFETLELYWNCKITISGKLFKLKIGQYEYKDSCCGY